MLKVSIFIDANNFKNRVYEALNCRIDLDFDFEKLVEHLVGNDRVLTCACYYSALPIQAAQDRSPFRQEKRLMHELKLKRKFRVEEGFYDISTQTEKGTDINISTDMLMGAFHNAYDVAILISADQDYKKVVNSIRSMGKIVELALPERARAGELIKNTDHFIRLMDDELKSFWKPNTGPNAVQAVAPNVANQPVTNP